MTQKPEEKTKKVYVVLALGEKPLCSAKILADLLCITVQRVYQLIDFEVFESIYTEKGPNGEQLFDLVDCVREYFDFKTMTARRKAEKEARMLRQLAVMPDEYGLDDILKESVNALKEIEEQISSEGR